MNIVQQRWPDGAPLLVPQTPIAPKHAANPRSDQKTTEVVNMKTNYAAPDLTRRTAFASMSAMAVGLIAMPAAANLLMGETFAAEAAIDTAASLRSIEAEPFLVTF